MRKQTILSLAIISILPFAAKADPIGPAHVNSGAVVATASAPYAIAGEETGDTTNVVSASYVKGAYNDAISAINKVNSDKQDKLIDFESNNPMYNKVVGSSFNAGGVGNNLVYGSNDEYAAMTDDIARQATDNETGNLEEVLISAGGAFAIVRDAGHILQSNIDTVQNSVNNKRVSALDTWGSNHTAEVALINHQ